MPHTGKSSDGSLAGSEAGGMAVRPHLCLGQKPKRQTPALVHGAVRLSGVPCLDCRGADGIPVRARLFHRSPSASRKFVGAAVLSDGQEDPRMNGLRHGRPPSGPRSSMIQKSRRSERTCGKYTVEVNGMMCGMCEAHVNDAVRKACPVKKVSSSRSKNQTVISLKQSWTRRLL